MTESYILTETIDYISEKFDARGHSMGWYIRFQGSGEAIYLSPTQPAWITGDLIKITMEKINA